MSAEPAVPSRQPSGLWQRLRPILAGPAKAGLRWVERTLHPWRRRRAQARLLRQRPISRMIVLCYGNICRSPYAALALQRELQNRGMATEVNQGGFFGPDRPANDRGKAVALSRGIDLSDHRSRLVTREDAGQNGIIVVMEGYQADKMVSQFGATRDRLLILGDLDPAAVESRAIPDPYGLDVAFFERTFDRIDRCVLELARLADPAAKA